MIPISVCLAGASGWAGSALAKAIAGTDDISLVSAVSRTHSGQVLGDVLQDSRLAAPVFSSVREALSIPCLVMVEFTKPSVAKQNILAALEGGAHVVIGTSGLTESDFSEIEFTARKYNRGVLACGNFALTVVLLQRFAEMAAKYIPHWEIIDYAHDDKMDVPSGTARELAYRLSQVRNPRLTVPFEELVGPLETRGATVSGSQVHSVRLPGYTISAEVIFGMPDQKLIIRHEAGSSAQPYVDGALLAIRKVPGLVGLYRGLDQVMDF